MLTVFIATHNRLETLRRSVLSYRRMHHPYQLVLVDNGSDHPACLALLDELAELPEVKTVYRLAKVSSRDDLAERYNEAMTDQYRRRRKTDRWYAVSDADICFDGSSSWSLDAYIRVAEATGGAAGPHLRVRDIPHGYPLRSRVLATEARILDRKTMTWLKDIPYSHWQIDTTFHLFPPAPEHDRLRLNCVRVGPPYDAQHLDWYVDALAPTEGDRIYITDPGSIGGWGRGWLASFWTVFQADRHLAFEVLNGEQRNPSDLCNVSFLLSWCHQYGHGTKANHAASVRALREAIPAGWDQFWANEQSWMQMIYADNFKPLGWE